MARLTDSELIQEAELVILESGNKLTLTALAAKVNARLKPRHPTWRSNLGKGRLLDAIIKSEKFRLKGEIAVLADATLMRGGVQVGVRRPKRKK